MFFSHSLGWAGLVVCGALLSTTTFVSGNTLLLEETFGDDPIGGGRATAVNDPASSRFAHAGGALTASYDTAVATTKLVWGLGQTLTSADSFFFEVDMTIRSVGFFADPAGFAQLAFGLQNSATTGLDRAGGGSADGFDIVTIDYFPNISPSFGGPTLAPTVINSDDGTTGFFGSLQSPFGPESGLDDEGSLPRDASLHAMLNYDATARQATITFSDAGGFLAINSVGDGSDVGGGDGDITTIQLTLTPGSDFAVDQFGLLLWEDTWSGGTTSVAADVAFDRVAVTLVPEPAAVAMLTMMGLVGASLRRRPSA